VPLLSAFRIRTCLQGRGLWCLPFNQLRFKLSQITFGPPDVSVDCIATMGTRIFIGTRGSSLFYSSDDGAAGTFGTPASRTFCRRDLRSCLLRSGVMIFLPDFLMGCSFNKWGPKLVHVEHRPGGDISEQFIHSGSCGASRLSFCGRGQQKRLEADPFQR